MNDLYGALGVDAGASADELKRAYRAIARESHPDRNPGDGVAEARFKAAAEAYRVLADPEKRRAYDAERSPPPTRTAPPRRSSRTWLRERGDDLRYTVRLSFEQAALGSRETLELPDEVPCAACGGTGAAPGQSAGPCPDCGGEGTRPVAGGYFPRSEPCRTCRGTGRVVRATCRVCAGLGTTPGTRRVVVEIPPGLEDGDRLRLSGEGRPGVRGGPPGDLIVVVDIEPHPFFERSGADIVVEVPISIGQAVLGGHVEIPTLEGQMRMRLPPGTQTGRVFRLKGQGLGVRGRAERGDQRVTVVVHVPESLTEAQRDLIERWAQQESFEGGDPVGRYHRELRKLYS